MERNGLRHTLLLLPAILCLVAACDRNRENAQQASTTVIKLAQRDWLSFKLSNMVAKILLEEKLG
ncbi:MAG: hypothetical protein GY801_01015 [bacterium]|nr:hypothetical protein [bacterium]